MKVNQENNKAIDTKLFSSFDRNSRVGEYKVDEVNELIIDLMNNQLIGADDQIEKIITGSKAIPSIIITGVPRSGTTLISQLLPARYDLGYVSNLMARFYKAPLTGAWLQKYLMSTDIHGLRDFSSHHGVTKRIYEPHEFGYFWSQHLNFKANYHEPRNDEELKQINFSALDKAFSEISAIFDKPVVYKCAVAPFVMQSMMKTANVFVIHITRSKQETVNSILKVRKQRLGSIDQWWSIRPYGWENLMDKSPQNQVSWQYDRVINSIRQGYRGYENRVFELSYEELVMDPEYVLETIMKSFNQFSGLSIKKVGDPICL